MLLRAGVYPVFHFLKLATLTARDIWRYEALPPLFQNRSSTVISHCPTPPDASFERKLLLRYYMTQLPALWWVVTTGDQWFVFAFCFCLFVCFSTRVPSYLQPHDQRQILVVCILAVGVVEPPEHMGSVPDLHIVPDLLASRRTGEPCVGSQQISAFCFKYKHSWQTLYQNITKKREIMAIKTQFPPTFGFPVWGQQLWFNININIGATLVRYRAAL